MYCICAIPMVGIVMKKVRFEWDVAKAEENQVKHGVSFSVA